MLGPKLPHQGGQSCPTDTNVYFLTWVIVQMAQKLVYSMSGVCEKVPRCLYMDVVHEISLKWESLDTFFEMRSCVS